MTPTFKRLLPVIALLLFFLIFHSRYVNEGARIIGKRKLLMGLIVEIMILWGPGAEAGRSIQAIAKAFVGS